ncbi:ribonuclease H-like domain-containing protein, partial [Panaeolus papilionaceus]
SSLFWQALARIKSHLAPLAIAANITQSAHCRLDDVLLTFASLYIAYLSLTDNIDKDVKESLLKSIEKRWEQSDQEVFIAAVLLNPFIRASAFRKDPTLFSTGAVHRLFSDLWRRFYNEEPPPSLYQETSDYLKFTGQFSSLSSVVDAFKHRAKAAKESPSPLDVYADITIPGEPPCPLIKLALHILHICPNSASCERLFSTFGLILTKLRTRLSSQRVVGLAECKLHLRDRFTSKENRKNLRRRLFGAPAELRAQQEQVARDNPNSIVPSQHTASAGPASPMDTDTAPHSDSQGVNSSSSPSISAALRILTAKHIALLETDADTALESGSRVSRRGDEYRKRTIVDLFDFASQGWVAFQQASAAGSVEDEMELYELLDLDADGEFDYDLDDSMDSILTI